MKWINFISKRLREKMRQGHTSRMLMKQCLNTIEYLQPKEPLYLLSLNYQIFIIHQRITKMVNYYLLQREPALQHIPYIGTLNK